MSDEQPSTQAAATDPEPLTFERRDQLRDLTLELLQKAQREVLILSQQLDPYSYNSQAVQEALKQLALRSHRTKIHILLQDNEAIQRNGHRLLDLAQRLSSRILIHRPNLQEHRELAENFLVVDETGYLRQPLSSRPEGIASFYDPAEARQLSYRFDEIWQQSSRDSLLRRLSI